MPTLSTDTCNRPDQSGLGTASDGETYTVNGTITTSIASNEAVITGSGTFTSVILGTQTTADINFLVRVEQTNNNFDGVGPCWRSSADGQNCYFMAIYNGSLLFAKLVSNGFTQLASAAISEVSATFYWIHVIMAGNHLQARVWADGSGEPGSFDIDTTDSTYTAAGRYGMSFNAFSGSGVKFDHITVTDNQSGATNVMSSTDIIPASDGFMATNIYAITESVPSTDALTTMNAYTPVEVLTTIDQLSVTNLASWTEMIPADDGGSSLLQLIINFMTAIDIVPATDAFTSVSIFAPVEAIPIVDQFSVLGQFSWIELVPISSSGTLMPPSIFVLGTAIVIASGRDGVIAASGRDGIVIARGRG